MHPFPGSNRRHLWVMVGLLLMVALVAPALAAMLADRHSFVVERERGDLRLKGSFNVSLGSVVIGEAARGNILEVEVDLEEERLTPSLELDREEGVVNARLAFEEGSRTGFSWRHLRSRDQNTWRFGFDRETPLDLEFDLGLAEGELDLTGFRVESLRVRAGMSNTSLTFNEPNPSVMTRLNVDAGAGRFRGEKLGNARFERMTFQGGAGAFELDFTGADLPAGARADIDVGVSRLRVQLPSDKAVVLHAPDSWLTRVSIPVGYVNQGSGLWHSAPVQNEDDAFHLHINAGLGRVTVEAP